MINPARDRLPSDVEKLKPTPAMRRTLLKRFRRLECTMDEYRREALILIRQSFDERVQAQVDAALGRKR